MNRLFAAEFRKFFARDVVRLAGLLVVLASVLAGVGAFITSVPLPPGRAAEADAAIRTERKDLESQIRQCRERGGLDPRLAEQMRERGVSEEIVEQIMRRATYRPSRHECLQTLRPGPAIGGDLRFHFPAAHLISVTVATFPLVVISLVLGATLAGAEWGAGTMTTLLSWEPRRVRLFAVKVSVIVFGVALSFLMVEALLALGVLPAAISRGSFAGMDRWWAEDLFYITARGAPACVLAALLGFGLASLIRNTTAAVGGLFAYLIVVETVLRAVTRELNSWLITNNMFLALRVLSTGGAPTSPLIEGRSPEEALGLLSLYCLGLCTLSGALFWRRDVA